MANRIGIFLTCLFLAGVAAWVRPGVSQPVETWQAVAPGVYRSPGSVGGYAIVDGDRAILVDAPLARETVKLPGSPKIEAVYLTHYHRPVCRGVAGFLEARVPVRAPARAKEWLSREGVAKFWAESLPLRSSRTAYLVVPEGFDGLDTTLEPGQKIVWNGWTLELHEAAGNGRAQLAFLASRRKEPRILFVGGALAGPGKLFAPYLTDWDHWTDAGLKPAAQTLESLAEVSADIVCPSYGPVLTGDVRKILRDTAVQIAEAGFLKSFERYTKDRLKNPPEYAFLAKDQAQSNGSKPWSRVSEHLFLTGNTYVLTSREGACLMVDPWGLRSVEQWEKLRKDQKLGELEVVWFSHAHYDHYDGVYDLPMQDRFRTWTLDLVAPPLVEPYRWRAPFLDPRPVRIDERPRAGDTLAWREYRFRFHHLPGQSLYTMGVETEIDGKKCYFTADNFYHQDMFAGTGGWMGLNRAFPPYYAESAKKVLDAAPDWVLAEHGGPFAFHPEDWRRRIAWAKAAGTALDALSLTGQHMHDYNPHHVHVEPVVLKGKPGSELSASLVGENVLDRKLRYEVTLEGRGEVTTQRFVLEVPARSTARLPLTLKVPGTMPRGRHVLALTAHESGTLCPADAFVAIDVE